MYLQFAQYLDLARCNRSASLHQRNRTSLSTVILTYRRWIWPFAHGAQQRCHRSRGQDNTISARMEYTRHTVLFRKYWCAPEHSSFYALTSLFPSISRYKSSGNTRAAKSGDSDDTTDPGPEDSRAVRKLTFIPSNAALPNAVVNFNGSQKELRSFTAALLVHLGPLSGSSPW